MSQRKPTRRSLLAAGAAGFAGLLAGCSGGDTTDGTPTETDSSGTTPTPTPTSTPEPALDWRTAELTDVLTGNTFSVNDLASPVVLETFAVWCPACTDQQKVLGELQGDDLSLLSLNTDPNEDTEKVRNHAEEHGFDWRYAVAPVEYTRALVDEFGSGVTVAPRTPVIVVCEDGSATFLDNLGIETTDRIRSAAAEC